MVNVMPKIAVILPAAGRGERFGGADKVVAKLDGRPVFIRTIELFINRDDVCQTLLVVSPEILKTIKEKYAANLAFMGVQVAEGGQRRCDSVRAALEKVSQEAELIAVHDAVRPCVSSKLIDAVFAEATKCGAAIPGCPIVGTLKRVSESGVIDETVSRAQLFEAQTPQVFKRQWLLDAYADPVPPDADVTDDSQLVEQAGHAVSVVTADATNLKITTKADLTLANAILKARPAATPKKSLGAFEEAQW